MRMLALLLAVPVAVATACAPRVDMAAEEAALRQADSAYTVAVQSKNLDAMLDLYAGDGVMYPPNEPTVSGLEGIRQYATNILNTPGLTVAFTPLDVRVSAGGTMGYTLNTGRITTADGSEEIRDFHVWRKEPDGHWKVVVDFWNSPPPVPPPPPPARRR